MKKSIIFLTVMAVATLSLFLIVKGVETSKNDEEIIKEHLNKKDFIYDENGGYYKKSYSSSTLEDYFNDVKAEKKSLFEELYFYLGLTRYNNSTNIYENNYIIDKVKMSYEDNISRIYSGNYNLIDEVIDYKYEITMYSSSIIVSGSYDVSDDESFTCDVESDRDMEDDSDVFCVRAKYETLSFVEQVKKFMSDPKFTKIIKENK